MNTLRRLRTLAADPDLRRPELRRLIGVRIAIHLGEGIHQAALGGVVLFSPVHQTDPRQIALGFAILLLPYSLIAPFISVTLDRWDRRRVLMVAAAVRLVVIVTSAVLIARGVIGEPGGVPVLFVLALVLGAAARFSMSGAGAALPLVVSPGRTVAVNSIFATIGAVVVASGALISTAVLAVLGPTDAATATVLGIGALATFAAFPLLLRFTPGALGPCAQRPGDTPTAEHATGTAAGAPTSAAEAPPAPTLLRGPVDAVRAILRAPSVAGALTALGAHRVAFGANTLVLVLVLREGGGRFLPGGLAGFGVAITSITVGMFAAAVITPILLPRLGQGRTIGYALAVLIVVQGGAMATLQPDVMVVAAFVFGVAGQIIKLSADAAMFLDIPDIERGRVFAFQDTLFNATFVIALAATALASGTTIGRAPIVLAAALYVAALLAEVAAMRRAARRPVLDPLRPLGTSYPRPPTREPDLPPARIA